MNDFTGVGQDVDAEAIHMGTEEVRSRSTSHSLCILSVLSSNRLAFGRIATQPNVPAHQTLVQPAN